MDVKVLEGYYYTKEHEWVKVKKNKGKIGITDYAQQKLGDITFVDLPDLDIEVKQSEYLAGIESVKAASDIFSPMSGKVISVNNKLEDKPGLINKSPYENGWIAEIEVYEPGDIKILLDHREYKKFVSGLE